VPNLENPLKPYFGSATFTIDEAKIGDVGWVREQVTVDQVVADGVISVATGTGSIQSIASSNIKTAIALRGRSYDNEWVKISGISTDGMKDGESGFVDALLVRTGNGFEPANLSAHADKFSRKSEVREWKSANGGHSRRAILVRNDGGKVALMSLDGKSADVELLKLSEKDRDYVRKWIAEQGKLSKPRRRR